jgi:import receptor subunit TOM22
VEALCTTLPPPGNVEFLADQTLNFLFSIKLSSYELSTTTSTVSDCLIKLLYIIELSRVKVQEVQDDDAWSSASSDIDDAASDVSDSELQLAPYDPDQETFAERFYALKDMVSPSTRAAVSDAADSTLAWTKWTANKVGNAAWIVTTSALLVGLPLLLSIEGEGALVQQEKEYLAQVRSPFSSRFRSSWLTNRII